MPLATTCQIPYIAFIQSCYRSHPEAFYYYNRLVDHLHQGIDQSQALQSLKIFRVLLPAPQTIYPTPFPFEITEWTEHRDSPTVVVLEGFPSPWCIALLGSKWPIRPEFFIGHLPLNDGGHYELPTLPSLHDNLARVHYVTLVKPLLDYRDTYYISRRRSDLTALCLRQEKRLVKDRKYGETRFRRVNLHDSQLYSIEQTISLTVVVEDADHWHALFLTDQGRPVINGESFPWSRYNSHGRPAGTLALVPYNGTPMPIPTPTSTPTQQGREDGLPGNLDQFHPLKNITVRDETDHRLLAQDPFFLFCGVSRPALTSWAQLLNHVAEGIQHANDRLELGPDELRFRLDQLQFHLGMVHRARELLLESLDFVRQGGCASWPRARDEGARARKRALQRGLEADHAYVLERCRLLVSRCESATSVLVGFAQLAASERAIAQAEEVSNLTRLATIFLPLTFAAGIFGMNITEWGPAVPLRWFFVAVALLTGLVFSYIYRDACGAALGKLWVKVKSLKRI
ncbi:hypothetical protein F5X99DRAFT_429367 [Biscogniauxia marginata]|nr:hypothetical protein F5X99DRAFT_429367 [Biscogniauxia marginata]